MRGVESRHEHRPHDLLRDTRPFGVRWGEIVLAPFAASMFYGMGCLWVWLTPASLSMPETVFLLALIYTFFFYRRCRQQKLPLRMPVQGNSSLQGDEGVFFLGNDRQNRQELWLSLKDIKTHFFVAGTTGSGKTQSLLASLSNSLIWGSGFTAVDGKADTSLWADMYTLVSQFGRQDDLLVLNFLTGDMEGKSVSHTLNPFSFASAGEISELIISLLNDAGHDAMWQGRAIALLKAVVPALTFKRNHQGLLLDISVIRNALPLHEVIKLSRDKSLPAGVQEGLNAYLSSLPGYSDDAFDDTGQEIVLMEELKGPSTTTCREQHNYLSMQFTEALGNLADHYGHIFKTPSGDIDMRDVVLNRRILLVLLPTLEKSGPEAANLGKIVVSNLKTMMASTLGATLEGDVSEVIEQKMSRAPSPYLCSFDEVGYYTTPGMGIMAAQGRSLGFSMIFSTQDLASMRKRIREEADSILANCNIKIFLKLEEALETRTLFEKSVGEAYVTQVSGFSNTSPFTGTYHDRLEAGVERRLRADYLDVKSQKDGEAHVLFSDQLIRANLFYAPLKHPETFHVNSFLLLEEDRNIKAEEDFEDWKPLEETAEDQQKTQEPRDKDLAPFLLPNSEQKARICLAKEKKEGLPSLVVPDVLSPEGVSQQVIDFESMFGMKADINAAEIRQHMDKLFSALSKPDESLVPSLMEEERTQNIFAFSSGLKELTLTVGDPS